MALARGTNRQQSSRESLTLLSGIIALVAYIAALFFINRLESRPTFIALGIFLVAAVIAIGSGHQRRPWLTFIVPALAVYTMFVMFPAVSALRFSLYNWTGLGEPTDYIGLGNYREIFSNSVFLNALTNNFELFLAIFAIQNLVGLPIAMALDTRLRGYQFYRAALFMPVIVSLVATAYIWQIILGPNIGMLNPLLEEIGLENLQRDWLANDFLTFKLIWIVQAWQYLGFPIIIYLAGLQAIPNELREAARIDGANGLQVFRVVVFPLLAPAFTVVTVISFIFMFRTFEIPFILGGPGGAPNSTTDVVTLVQYREAFGMGGIVGTFHRQGYAVAAGVVMFGFMMAAVAVQVLLLRRREVTL